MVFYIYNHDVNEIPEDACFLGYKKGDQIYEDITIDSVYKKIYNMMHYCEHCNSTLVGHWEYVDYRLRIKDSYMNYYRKDYDGKTLYSYDLNRLEKAKENGENISNFNQYYIEYGKERYIDIADYCYRLKNIPLPRWGEYVEFEIDENRRQFLENLLRISPKIIQYHNEIEHFSAMDACPICNKKFNSDPKYHITDSYIRPQNFYRVSSSEMQEHLNRVSSEKFNKLSEQRLAETTKKFDIKPSDKVFNKDSFDIECLKNYLNHICQLESNIFSITDRLKTLYPMYYPGQKDSMASQLVQASEIRDKLKRGRDSYNQLESTSPESTIPVEAYAVSYPQPPVPPQMPAQPQLKAVGMFNKKKTEEENNLLMQQYQASISAYNTQVAIYTKEAENYNCIVAQLHKKQNETFAILVAEAQKNKQERLNNLSEEIKVLESHISKIENGDSDIITPEKIKFDLITSEIKEAENTLCETYKALNELYSYDIIFGKYRNFVAVSTFYEYIASGRCNSLEGADGAYNLYENEIRANQIISQLSEVIVSLDKIQKNQYVIYKAIEQSNRQLKMLNSSMDTVISSLEKIGDTMDTIADNTAIAAHNSAVSAYYSKKNAELTNALGFMLALK